MTHVKYSIVNVVICNQFFKNVLKMCVHVHACVHEITVYM